MKNELRTSETQCVWVVETVHPYYKNWMAMDTRVSRAAAWALAREDRRRWPNQKFRVIKYVSSKS